MMTADEITAAAAALDAAERNRTQIGLLSLAHPAMTMDDAYLVQAAWMEMKRAGGYRQTGWKIGLTSRAMQQALGIDTPDSGVLLDSMHFANGATIAPGRFIQPRIEAEIAFVMKTGLPAQPSVAEVLAATEYVAPAIEILDTRILRVDPATGRARNVCDTIADNAANAGIIVGDTRVRPHDIDMRWSGAIVARNDVVEETGLGAGVLDHPARGVAWLASRLAGYGRAIEAGQVILSGSFIRPVECPAGSAISADFGPLGIVSCHFS